MIARRLRNVLIALHGGAGDGDDVMLIAPLTIAVLIKYFRPFGSGRRPRRLHISQALDLAERLKASHEHFRKIRDWHIVHPVNRYEVHNVTLAVSGLGTDDAHATAVSSSSTAIHGLSIADVDNLIALCDYWLGTLNEEKVRESASLLEEAKRLSPRELNSLPDSHRQPHENPFLQR